MKRKLSVMFAVALAALLLVAAAGAQAYALKEPPSDREKAEWMVRVAEGSCLRLGKLINMTRANATALQAIQNAGLMQAFEGNVSLYESGRGLLFEAKVRISNGDYGGAMNITIRAMGMFRNALRNIKGILEKAGVEKGDLLKAQGLIIAANRALERIQRIEKIVPDSAVDVKELLDKAKSLLNMTEITQMLQQGRSAEVAKRLAEANRLINDAFKALKAKAEEKMAERMHRFCEKLENRFGELIKNMTKAGLNVTDFLRKHNMSQFRENLNQFRRGLRKEPVKGALAQLEKFQWMFGNFSRKVTIAIQPKNDEGAPAIKVTVEKSAEKGIRNTTVTLLKVTVMNVGNATVQFPNSVYGIAIERREGAQWKHAYSPISAQVIVELKPGQAGQVQITLQQPQNGQYRVRVHGWSKISMTPVEASAEFSIP
ncbi:MAG: hypothetical protein RMK50_05655 [Nitrososphaerota archaeon]|nr:hypothetical protein [Candidatus Bathyarchaeota archaeon]MDW8194286.1 hypothetical protein [Nitrososphaerota archaeon]